MAVISNAVIRWDPSIGPNSTLTALSAVNFSNNGGIVMGTKVAHGLTTGQVVAVGGVYNGFWKVTVLTADTFNLDESIYSSLSTGVTITPFRGYSWSDPCGYGNQAFQLDAGRNNKVIAPKSQDPFSLGTCTMTNGSYNFTIPTELTTLVDNCETAWTPVGSATCVATNSGAKEGARCINIAIPANTPANTRLAYKTLTTMDLSDKDALTFWLGYTTLITVSDKLRVKLCSDTLGQVPVDEFIVGNIYGNSSITAMQTAMTLKRLGEGSLGSNIQSIALWTGTEGVDTILRTVLLDNINACNFTSLHLNSGIGTSGSWTGAGDFFTIKSISGTSLVFDRFTASTVGTAINWGRPSGNYELFIYNGIIINQASFFNLMESIPSQNGYSTLDVFTLIEGGYNTANDTREGYTLFTRGITYASAQCSGISMSYANCMVKGIGFCRGNKAIFADATPRNNYIDDIPCVFGLSGEAISLSGRVQIGDIYSSTCNYYNLAGSSSYKNTTNVIGKIHNLNYGTNAGVLTANMFNTYLKLGTVNYPVTISLGTSSSAYTNDNVVIEFDEMANNLSGALVNVNRDSGEGKANISLINGTIRNSASYGAVCSYNIKFKNCTFRDNPNGHINMSAGLQCYATELFNCELLGSGTEVYIGGDSYLGQVISYNHDKVDGLNKIFHWSYPATKTNGVNGVVFTNASNSQYQVYGIKAYQSVAKVACKANELVTVNAIVNKSSTNAGSLVARLWMKPDMAVGVDGNLYSATTTLATGDQTLTLSFTPTAQGVSEIYLEMWSMSALADTLTLKYVNKP